MQFWTGSTFNAYGRNVTPTTPVPTSKSQRFFPSSLVLTKLPTIIVDRLKRVSVFPPVVRIQYSAFLYPTQVSARLVYRSSCNLLRILTSYKGRTRFFKFHIRLKMADVLYKYAVEQFTWNVVDPNTGFSPLQEKNSLLMTFSRMWNGSLTRYCARNTLLAMSTVHSSQLPTHRPTRTVVITFL